MTKKSKTKQPGDPEATGKNQTGGPPTSDTPDSREAVQPDISKKMQKDFEQFQLRYRAVEKNEKTITDSRREARPTLQELAQQRETIMSTVRAVEATGAVVYWDLGETAQSIKSRLGHGLWLPYVQQNYLSEKLLQRAIKIFEGFSDRADCAGLSMRKAEDILRNDRKKAAKQLPDAARHTAAPTGDFDADTVAHLATITWSLRRSDLTEEEQTTVDQLCASLKNENAVPPEKIFAMLQQDYAQSPDRAVKSLAFVLLCLIQGAQ